VSDVLGEVFRRAGMKRGVRRAEAVLLWPRVVGREVARFTTARTLQGGVLYVDVSDSETGMHLSLQRQRFLDVYHTRFHVRDVHDIRFRVGRPEAPAEAARAPTTTAPDPHELAKLARHLGTKDLPEAVAGAAMQAGRAMLGYRARRAAEGWAPCPTCGALTPDGSMCAACRRYAIDGRVLSAGRHLAMQPGTPTPELGEEERAVADHLAAAYLDRTLAELLPQALGDPGLRPQLERAARCRAALAAGTSLQALDERDLDRLDPRVRRVLGIL
jgi:hypothetical protein